MPRVVPAFLVLLSLLGSPDAGPSPSNPGSEAAIPGFCAFDVVCDGGEDPLAAWQVEVEAPKASYRLVGVEGGESPAFAEPPRFDPAALGGGLVKLAALSLARDLPKGRTRVARLHFECVGEPAVMPALRPIAAAGPEGRRLSVGFRLERSR